ncbi:MAG: glycosyltransferase [Deltaproteobacteria bacterium]|nr:glycosyltransferase [Deltaproteobacteria bacterium]
MKPVIAHINSQYFALSETFMYFYLSSFRRTHPICLSQLPFINRDLFPFPASDSYETAIPMRHLWRWFEAGLLRRLAGRRILAERILRKRKALLIHAHYGPVGWWALSVKKRLDLPLVTNFYGFDVAPEIEEEGPEWPRRRRQLFEEGDLFLVEGPHMARRLVELGCPSDKVQLQHIAIKVREIPFRPRKPKPRGKVAILFAGRFYEKKGLSYALEAVNITIGKGRDIEFRLIGDGPLMPDVQRYVKEHRLDSYVRLLGLRNYGEYLKELHHADVFLHPSVTAANGDSEGGAPTTILEAQASGVPILSTHHADIPYVVVPDKSALLVAERDSDALAEALLLLLDHQEAWEEMGRAGRAHVEAHHDVGLEVEALENKYFTLLGEPS